MVGECHCWSNWFPTCQAQSSSYVPACVCMHACSLPVARFCRPIIMLSWFTCCRPALFVTRGWLPCVCCSGEGLQQARHTAGVPQRCTAGGLAPSQGVLQGIGGMPIGGMACKLCGTCVSIQVPAFDLYQEQARTFHCDVAQVVGLVVVCPLPQHQV